MADSTKTILIELLENGRQSRAALARKMQLSRPAVSAAVDKLLSKQLVLEAGVGESSGGKPPTLLELNPKQFAAIGVDMGNGAQIRALLFDGNTAVTDHVETDYNNSFNGIVDGIAKVVKILQLRNAETFNICGVGLAVPGVVDTGENEIMFSANFDIANHNMADTLESRLKLPVKLVNRARAAALAEWRRNVNNNNSDSFVYINFDFGIGSVTYHGGLLNGQNFSAGEIRDMIVPRNDGGILSYGPLESTLQRIFAEYGTGADPNCYRRYLTPCLYVIKLFSLIMDPDRIVLGGRFMLLGESFLAELRNMLQHELPQRKHLAELQFNQSGLNGVASGAALKILQTYVNNLNIEDL